MAGMALACFFPRKTAKSQFLHTDFSGIGLPRHKTIGFSEGSILLLGAHFISRGWETVQALLDSGADPRAQAHNGGGRQRDRLEDELR